MSAFHLQINIEGMKVLIVDDEAIIRRSLRRVAEIRGHEVLEAKDGEEGLALWTQENPDLVFLDVLMPKLSGPEILKSLGKRNKSKVVLISAYTGEYDIVKAQNIGANLFLPKPFEDIFKTYDEACELVNE